MANGLSRNRKRVRAPLRAPDGSAFDKCEYCGVSVAIALLDMHECGGKEREKRIKCESNEELDIREQPRSSFRCFMESFKKMCVDLDWLEIDRRGFDKWRNMSREERRQYDIQAEKVNAVYVKILLEEIDDVLEVDDEADSAMVGKFDPISWHYEDSSDYCGSDFSSYYSD